MSNNKTFTYFAYASNLLKKRIHINNPSAERVGIGKLNDYQLTFDKYSTRWKGASATIIPYKGRSVWGAIWELDLIHKNVLDNQEGVPQKVYVAKEIEVQCPNGELKICRLYQQLKIPETIEDIKDLPKDKLPSKVYLDIILNGANESELPIVYQEFLKTIPHNGYDGQIDINLDLDK